MIREQAAVDEERAPQSPVVGFIRSLRYGEIAGLPALWVYAIVALPVVLSFAVYWPTLGDYFVQDDYLFLQQVHNHSAWQALLRAFSFPADTAFEKATPGWRPATDTLFQIEHAIFGSHPTPYHVVCFALNGLVAALGGLFVARL